MDGSHWRRNRSRGRAAGGGRWRQAREPWPLRCVRRGSRRSLLLPERMEDCGGVEWFESEGRGLVCLGRPASSPPGLLSVLDSIQISYQLVLVNATPLLLFQCGICRCVCLLFVLRPHAGMRCASRSVFSNGDGWSRGSLFSSLLPFDVACVCCVRVPAVLASCRTRLARWVLASLV
jgi:hypothetical protein